MPTSYFNRRKFRHFAIWIIVAATVTIPIAITGMSPLLQWRGPVYIAAGFFGVIAMSLLLLQPLLIAGLLPGLTVIRRRSIHKWVGAALVVSIAAHVIGLWLTSAPDVIDALLFVSPTPFSAWGVIAMWSLFAAAFLVAMRRKLPLTARQWRMGHRVLVGITVIGSVVHAILIEGAMGTVSKVFVCAAVVFALGYALFRKSYK